MSFWKNLLGAKNAETGLPTRNVSKDDGKSFDAKSFLEEFERQKPDRDAFQSALQESDVDTLREISERHPGFLENFFPCSDSKQTELLIKIGASVHEQIFDGMTALMMAADAGDAYNGSNDDIKVLVQYGADLNAVSEDGKTALDYAVLSDNKDAISLFRELGAARNYPSPAKVSLALSSITLGGLPDVWTQEVLKVLNAATLSDSAVPDLLRGCKSSSLLFRKNCPVLLAKIYAESNSEKALSALVEATLYPDADTTSFRILLSIKDERLLSELFGILKRTRCRDIIFELIKKNGAQKDIRDAEGILGKIQNQSPGMPDDWNVNRDTDLEAWSRLEKEGL